MDNETYLHYVNLLAEVRSIFSFTPQPHISAYSPDKPRYHVFDSAEERNLLFDTVEEIDAFIQRKHRKMSNSEDAPSLQIEETNERIVVRYQTKEGIRTIYNVHTFMLRYMGIAPERGIAHILSQDMDLLQLFVEDWKRLQAK